jgi:peptide deformylase
MTVRPLVFFPDPRLSVPSKAIEKFDATLEDLIRDLTDTMRASPGVGLAAPQIGVNKRVSVIDVSRKVKKTKEGETCDGLIVLINPMLTEASGTQTPREGCLSVPDLLGNVQRFAAVTVQTQTPQGESRFLQASGFEALAFQHEIDHLDGKLFLDRVSNIKTDIFRRQKS